MGQPVYDGNTSFLGGQNSGLEPGLLNPTQYFTGINTSNKNGSIRSRPGFLHFQDIEVLTEGGEVRPNLTVTSYQRILRNGKFQGAGPLISDQGKFIVAIISGIIFRINPSNKTAVVLKLASGRLNQYADRHYWSQAGKFFVIFDYPDYPVIIDGIEARRADPTKYEIPLAAVIGAFNQSRLFVFSSAHEFTAGDPVGNPLTPDAPITFEEVFAPASAFLGQAFSLGSTNVNNPITAVGYLEAIDSSTGIGPMFVATNKVVYAFQTQLERTQWGITTFGTKVLSTSGITGQRAFVNVGSDLWFMGGDARIRSFSVARGDQAKWARTPLDKEVKNWMRLCDRSLLKYTVAAYHNNRIFFTVNPQLTSAKDLDGNKVLDISFKGIVSLGLDPVSGFLQNPSPAWEGLWTGVNPMELIELDQDLYIFSKDPGNVNTLYFVESDEITWDTYQGKKKQITSRIETRGYSFAQEGLMYSLKEEVTVFPGLRDVGGKFCFQLERKNDEFPNYTLWRTFKHDAPVEQCTINADKTISNLVAHSFREINFGDPKNSLGDKDFCNPVTKEKMNYFNETQFRITITGLTWQLTSFRVKAELQEDDMLINVTCETDTVKLNKECETVSDFDLYSTAFKEEVWECQQIEC